MSFNLVFFSSSDFVLPLLESIYGSQGKTLKQIILDQLKYLDNNLNPDEVLPKFWNNKKAIIQALDLPVFNELLNLKLIISQPGRENRGKVVQNPIAKFAIDKNIPLFTPEKLNKSKSELFAEFNQVYTEESSEIKLFDGGIVASYGQIIAGKVLNLAKHGFVNWHPSLLPLYRGPIPMPASLSNGDKYSGLSWIEMTKEMDAGNIWMQYKMEVENSDRIDSLSEKLIEVGRNTWALILCAKILENPNETFKPIIQDSSKATFTKLLAKEDAQIDLEKLTANEVYNHWRAFLWFPGTKFYSEYFHSNVKLVDLEYNLTNRFNLDSQNIIYEDDEWIQTKSDKNRVYLKAKADLIEVTKILLETGKQIDFRGYVFK